MAKEKTPALSEEFVKTHAENQFKGMRPSQELRARQAEKDNRLYRGEFSDNEKRISELLGKQLLFIKKTYTHVQRYVMDILEAVFQDPDEIVRVKGGKNIPWAVKEIVKGVLNYILNGHPNNFYFEAYETALDGVRNGMAVLKVYPKPKKKGQVPDFCVEAIHPLDVFVSKEATWKDYWKYPICHRFKRSKDYFKRLGYKNLDLVNLETTSLNDASRIGEDFDQPQGKNEIDGQQMIYGFEFWDYLDINGDGLLEKVRYVMLGNQSGPQVLGLAPKENKLPYGDDLGVTPITIGMVFPESHSMEGRSLPWQIEDLQKETNAIRNQRREAVALKLRQPLLIQRGANVDLLALARRKFGSTVQGDDISENAIRELKLDDPTITSMQEMARTDQDLYEADSVAPSRVGAPSSGNTTATETATTETNANKKAKFVITNLSYTLYIPAMKKLLALVQVYGSDEWLAKITGQQLGWGMPDDGVPMLDMIQGEIDLTVEMGISKQQQLNQLFLLMDRGTQANAAGQQLVASGTAPAESVRFINTPKFFEDALKVLGRKDVEEYSFMAQVPPPEFLGKGKGVASQAESAPIDLLSPVSQMNPGVSNVG